MGIVVALGYVRKVNKIILGKLIIGVALRFRWILFTHILYSNGGRL